MGDNFKILGVVVLVVALGVAGWFFSIKQSQKNTEVKNENQQEEKQVVKEDSQKQGEEKVEELKTTDIDTSNWKTYRNEEFGFEVKYLEEWEVEKMKFATIWPAPVPVNCKKTPEKCPFEGVQLFNLNSQDDKIKYITIKVLASDEEYGLNDGYNAYKTSGSEFAPGDYCLFSYVKKIKNERNLLITTSIYSNDRCDKDVHNKLFDGVINSIK
jgi:hypothetical protein